MIPATQRPDGSWRKARKIRTGFYSNSGGATRYVPPAFRAGAASSGRDPAGGDAITRSLRDVDTGKAASFLDAALFLLLTPAPPRELSLAKEVGDAKPGEEAMSAANDRAAVVGQSTGESRNSGSSSGSGDNDSSRADSCASENALRRREGSYNYGLPPASPLRCAADAAKDKLGCDRCRALSPENGERNNDDDHDDREWWTGLRLAEQAWRGQPREATTAGGRGEESWVGLELSLRPSDVRCADGQAAVVDFLKRRVCDCEQVGTEVEEEEDCCMGVKSSCGGATRNETVLIEPRNNDTNNDSDSDNRAGVPVAITKAGYQRRTTSRRNHSDQMRERSQEGDSIRAVEDQAGGNSSGIAKKEEVRDDEGDNTRETREKAETTGMAAVVMAVLVFSRALSKRDRAELHGEAERAGGVGSSSHGVGEARFLTLSCSGVDEGRPAQTELELSATKASLARRLFRMAQDQYHSRYERLSHREIREVVAIGGPTAEDHPDLFRLLKKMNDDDASLTSGDPLAHDGVAAVEMTTTV